MNTTEIQSLLAQWDELIHTGESISKEKADKNNGGLQGRIRRTIGKPVIFDFETYEDQQRIQNLLCQKLPQWSDLIRSQPAIMNGYPWTRDDFIYLYFRHFRLVVEKLQRITEGECK
jgi:hypothetical protein